MRYALITAIAVSYYLGWLPAQFTVPILLAFSLLRVPPANVGPTPRRPGYVRPSSAASSGANHGMVPLVQTYTSSPNRPGTTSAVVDTQGQLRDPSRTGAPTASSLHAAALHGAPTTDADMSDAAAVTAALSRRNVVAPPFIDPARSSGDCGCQDDAA